MCVGYGPAPGPTYKRPLPHSSGRWEVRVSKDELISNYFLWSPTYRHTNPGWPANTRIHKLYTDTACSLEDLPGYRESERVSERERDTHIERLCSISTTLWRYIYIYIYIYVCVCVCVCIYIYIYIYRCSKTSKPYPDFLGTTLTFVWASSIGIWISFFIL